MRLNRFLSLLIFGVGISVRGGTTTNSAPMPLAEAVAHVSAPPGFRVTMFAGEPDVRQPIAMTFDDRGRLWVVENYTYTGVGNDAFDTNRRDRILIFEDSKGTGHFDKRTVFWDQGVRLTGIAVGFGGVFCTCAPNLIFIPDRNGNDVPDGPPEVLLDGWNNDQMHHTIVNGLKWGPDGWLYGRQGIAANSLVGRPGTPEEGRIKLNCAIWRYHPTRKIFEVVCQGGTNPWGDDWDQYGELFFVNTVIGHLWHAIPGAFYKRMFGEHNEPYRYDLIDQSADHYHWDTGHSWVESRNGSADALGGGHAHSGLMDYMGDNWPSEYYGHLFMLNFHGRRINQDIPERRGSGYVAHHGADLVKFGDPWFQGIDLDYGPDGGVTVLDWSDTGECHGSQGVHRETGRIYKLTYEGTNKPAAKPWTWASPVSLLTNGLQNFADSELFILQYHPNEWYARQARRILQERAARVSASFRGLILERYNTEKRIPIKLRLLFAYHAVGGDTTPWLETQLKDGDEHIRAWAVRFLGEAPDVDWDELTSVFTDLAARETSPLVRLYLASALQRVPKRLREPLAAALLQHGEDAADHNLPLMLWYGIEPIVAPYPETAIELALRSRIPLVRQLIARRLEDEAARDPKSINDLLAAAASADEGARRDVIRGVSEALEGRHGVAKAAAWDALRAAVEKSGDIESLELARKIGIVFGDPWALRELAKSALNPQMPADDRRAALQQVIDARPPGLAAILKPFLNDPVTRGVAARGLVLIGDPDIASWVLQRWTTMQSGDQALLAGAMASRPDSARQLLDAMATGAVSRSALNAFNARQIHNFHDPALNDKLAQAWGEVRSNAADKLQAMDRYRELLTPDRLKRADLSRGRAVFARTCAVCHKLYGEGAAIGPDLTGGGRANLGYLLENIIDPSAIVPADYMAWDVEMKDGRELTALIIAKTDHNVTFQTPTEKFAAERGEIASIRQTKMSLMPEGLLQSLKDGEVCNLIAYLMAPNQVPLPAAGK